MALALVLGIMNGKREESRPKGYIVDYSSIARGAPACGIGVSVSFVFHVMSMYVNSQLDGCAQMG